jgi:hypothetical protein
VSHLSFDSRANSLAISSKPSSVRLIAAEERLKSKNRHLLCAVGLSKKS